MWTVLSADSSVNFWGRLTSNARWSEALEDLEDDDDCLFSDISTPPDSLLRVVSSFVTCIFSFPAFPRTWNPPYFTSDFLLPETLCKELLLCFRLVLKKDRPFFGVTLPCFVSAVFKWTLRFVESFTWYFFFPRGPTGIFLLEISDLRKLIEFQPAWVTCTTGLSDLRTGYSAVPGLTTTWTESACAVTFAWSLVARIFKSPDLSSTWKCAFCPSLPWARASENQRNKNKTLIIMIK